MPIVLGVITARGGSKGIPRKNIIPLNGRPLIAYTIEAAKKSEFLDDLILSTDDREISECASNYGLYTDSLRPEYLASDSAKNSDVVIHAVKKYEIKNKTKVDTVVLLQPTSPMRISDDIDDAITIFKKSGAETLFSVYDATNVHPSIMYYYEKKLLVPVLNEDEAFKRRQEFRNVFIRNGALYITKFEYLIRSKTFVSDDSVPYIMPRERSVNIDEYIDLQIAECLMKNR